MYPSETSCEDSGVSQRGQYRLDLVALVDHPPVEVLFECPPHRLNIVVLERDIRVLQVDPVAHDPGHFLPVNFVLPHRLFAFIVELRDAELDDLVFVFKAERLFDFDFDGEPVRIPAGFPMHPEPPHGLVPAYKVFQCAAHDVVNPRPAIRCRRALVEGEFRSAVTRRDALVENMPLVPELQDFCLKGMIVDFVCKLLERHSVDRKGYLIQNEIVAWCSTPYAIKNTAHQIRPQLVAFGKENSVFSLLMWVSPGSVTGKRNRIEEDLHEHNYHTHDFQQREQCMMSPEHRHCPGRLRLPIPDRPTPCRVTFSPPALSVWPSSSAPLCSRWR